MVVLSPEVPLPTTTMEATISSFRQNTHARTHLQPSKAHAFDHHKALPSASTRIRWFLWLLAGMILATFLVSGASLMASIAHKPPRQVLLTLPPQQPPSQTPTPSQQAKATVQQYYDYWNHKHYLAAYNLLAPEYQKKHPYSELYPSYVATERADITFESTTQLADGTVKVMITDRATEQSSSGTVTRTYHGYYIAAQENGTWKLTPHF